MLLSLRSLTGMVVAAVMLAACGGGGGTVTTVSGGGGGVAPAGSLTIAPTTLTFTGPGDAPKTFTVSSTLGNVAAPSINTSGCAPVATVSTTSAVLPATYTVTPQANGNCSFVFSLGNASATVGVNVGSAGNAISGSASTVALFLGGTNGTVSVTAAGGLFTFDSTACNGIASVAPVSSTSGAATYTITPVGVGTCQLPIVNGSATFMVAVSVNAAPSGPAALTLTTTSMTFASPAAPPQQATLNFTGSVGQVSIDESDCIGNTGKPKIAFLTLNGVPPGAPVSLPQTFTVTLYGTSSGTCAINFVPQNGTGTTLTVAVQ